MKRQQQMETERNDTDAQLSGAGRRQEGPTRPQTEAAYREGDRGPQVPPEPLPPLGPHARQPPSHKGRPPPADLTLPWGQSPRFGQIFQGSGPRPFRSQGLIPWKTVFPWRGTGGSGERSQAVMQEMGSGGWRFHPHPPLPSCSAAWFPMGQGPVPVLGGASPASFHKNILTQTSVTK